MPAVRIGSSKVTVSGLRLVHIDDVAAHWQAAFAGVPQLNSLQTTAIYERAAGWPRNHQIGTAR
jgi:hypothetical protein